MSILQEIINQIRPYMNEQGYTFSKKCFYKIHNDIAFCLAFDIPGGLVYATFFVMPLYIPCQNRYYTYGNRVSSLRRSKLLPLSKSASDDELNAWCELLLHYVEKFIFPFFQKIDTPEKLVNVIENRKYISGHYFTCPTVELWRLQLFSYLYIADFDNLYFLAEKYPFIIEGSTFLTETVRNFYLEENDAIAQLAQKGLQKARAFCTQTIEDTIRNCFG
jgi:hypothetical protein